MENSFFTLFSASDYSKYSVKYPSTDNSNHSQYLFSEYSAKQNITKSQFKTPKTPKTPNKTLYKPSQNTPSKTPRKSLYSEYLPLDFINAQLINPNNSTFYKGTLRINKRNRHHAYVTTDTLTHDIFIHGTSLQNRALNGDIVIVEILSGDEKEKETQKFNQKNTVKLADNNLRQQKCDIQDGSESDDSSNLSSVSQDKDCLDENEAKIFGKIVHIVERIFKHDYAGILKMETPNRKSDRVIWFIPNDKTVPFIAIDRELAPKEFLDNPNSFDKTFFTASIRKWPINALSPFGNISGKLGQMGELVTETDALLIDAGITWDGEEFFSDIIRELPKVPWTMPLDEIKLRRDFREERIFSIDPLTAKDLDDAVSIKILPDGTYELGVHIADVSYFVPRGSKLDNSALYRATTIYLVQRAIPMLPRILSEELCSLNPGVDRFSFSVVWNIDANAKILGEPWFGKSIIKTCGKLAYEHAQAIIDGETWDHLPPVEISNGVEFEDIKKDVLLLYNLSQKLRKQRYDNGALSFQSIKLWFSLDDTGNPTDSGVYKLKDSNRLIEEFMLLANMAVAKKICDSFPEAALLRCHPPPLERGLKNFLDKASKLGYKFDATNAGSLHASFESIEDEVIRHTWRLMAIKFMKRAQYFNTGNVSVSQFSHYALNVPLYTHFTSPIRRYSDLVVHRMLQAILDGAKNPYYDTQVANIAKQCNSRKESAKTAQDASQNLYLVAFLDKLAQTEPLIEDAIVTEVGTRFYDVIVPRFGIEKRVWVEDLIEQKLVRGCQFQENKNQLKIHWIADANENLLKKLELLKLSPKDQKTRNDGEIKIQTIKTFDIVKVKILPLMTNSPPVVKLLGMNPEEGVKPKFAVKQDVIVKVGEDDHISLQARASCPGMAEDRD